MSRVAMITTRQPQEEMILSRLSARKIQASERYDSIPVPLVYGTKQNHSTDTLSQKRFFRGPPKENYIGKLCY